MGEVVQFVSRATTTAEKNLAAFVSLARDELTAFSEGGAWDELTWRNDLVSVVFCKYCKSLRCGSTTPASIMAFGGSSWMRLCPRSTDPGMVEPEGVRWPRAGSWIGSPRT